MKEIEEEIINEIGELKELIRTEMSETHSLLKAINQKLEKIESWGDGKQRETYRTYKSRITWRQNKSGKVMIS